MRRQLFQMALLVTLVISCEKPNSKNVVANETAVQEASDPFQLYDLHVHLKGDLTINEAIRKSREDNVKYGIAVNCGLGFPVQSDEDIVNFLDQMKQYPQFYMAMQAEGREWVDLFTADARSKFDYVFTDAMTFTDPQGRRNRIWIPEETWVDDEEEFMDYLVQVIVGIMDEEPINIYVNATYLPDQIAENYDELWTEERMDLVIEAAKRNQIAIEISNRFHIPSASFIKRAKDSGIKFTSGTNNIDKDFPRPEYTLKMIEECGLTEEDFWLPERRI